MLRFAAVAACLAALSCGGPEPGPEDQPPVAQDGSLALDEDSGPAAGTLQGSDPDGTQLTFAAGEAAHGTVALADAHTGAYTYDPDPDFNGSDAFTFTVASGGATSDPATVTITVAPVNDPPRPGDDTAQTVAGFAVDIDVLANDVDVEGDALTVTALGDPTSGTATLGDNGQVTYTSDLAFLGDDTFTYTVSDGTLTADATVTVTVADPCVTPVLTFEGDVADGLGLAAWNSTGGAEPAATGHDLDTIDTGLSGTAEYYLATRDVVDENATAGAAATSLGPMPQTAAALAAGGYAVGQITLRTDLMSLGNDTLGWDWFAPPPVERRFYRTLAGAPSPAQLLLELDGEPLVTANTQVRVDIDYGDLADPSDDAWAGGIEWIPVTDASAQSSTAVQAVATAFLADLDQLGGPYLTMTIDTLRVASQGDFGAEGRTGRQLDVLGGRLFPYCE